MNIFSNSRISFVALPSFATLMSDAGVVKPNVPNLTAFAADPKGNGTTMSPSFSH